MVNSDRPRDTRPRSGEYHRRAVELVIGRMTDHGRANYQFRSDEDPSYYVKLLTTRGRKTLWGKDLERAINEGETQPKTGDLVGARRSRREAVTISVRQRDSEGRVTSHEERQTHRTHWIVEKVTFFAQRARLARRLRDEQADVRETVRAHPELKSTFLSVRAAEEFAAKRISNSQDRERFLDLVRGAMASSIRKGEPLPAATMRNRAQDPAGTQRTRDPKREDPTR
jgi:hypothetical protein